MEGSCILWRDAYKIGSKEIDDQHFQLFQEVERLVALTQDDGAQLKKSECLSVLNFLITYTENHFKAEEEFQRSINYVDYENHARIHSHFKNTVMQYKRDIEENFSEHILKAFVGTLLTWLTTHILNLDRKIMNNEPIGIDITLEDEAEYIQHIFKKIFADLYGIKYKEAKTSMYKSYVEGDIIIRTIVKGKTNHIFLYGISKGLASEIYTRISGFKINDFSNLDSLGISVFEEIGNMLSSNTVCMATKSKIDEFECENNVYIDQYDDETYNTSNSSVVKISTEFGDIEILCCCLQ